MLGDGVNIAARLQSAGRAGRCSGSLTRFTAETAGKIDPLVRRQGRAAGQEHRSASAGSIALDEFWRSTGSRSRSKPYRFPTSPPSPFCHSRTWVGTPNRSTSRTGSRRTSPRGYLAYGGSSLSLETPRPSTRARLLTLAKSPEPLGSATSLKEALGLPASAFASQPS